MPIAVVVINIHILGLGGFCLNGTPIDIKLSFSGLFPTALIFVSEIVGNMKNSNRYRGYMEIIISLGLYIIVSAIIYSLVIYLE